MAPVRKYIIFGLLIFLGFVTNLDAKRNYRLEVESFELDRDPKFMVQIKQLRLSKYNDTTKYINGNFTCTEDLPRDTMITATAYQLLASNKYSMIPVGMKPFNFCDVIKNDKQFYPAFLVNSNFLSSCPITKGDFWIKDFVPEFKDLPDELPGERWRLDWMFKSKKRLLNKGQAFFYVNRNI